MLVFKFNLTTKNTDAKCGKDKRFCRACIVVPKIDKILYQYR